MEGGGGGGWRAVCDSGIQGVLALIRYDAKVKSVMFV